MQVDLVETELVILRNTHIYACRYMNAITVYGRRGHEFKGKQEGIWANLNKDKKRKKS